MQQAYPEIQALGGEVYFIGPETEANALQLMEKAHATIPLLHDLDGAVMEAYRIAFTLPEEMRSERLPLADWNPAAGWRLPVPATFVVDQQGTIRARYVNVNYRRRMEPAEIVRALQEIRGGS